MKSYMEQQCLRENTDRKAVVCLHSIAPVVSSSLYKTSCFLDSFVREVKSSISRSDIARSARISKLSLFCLHSSTNRHFFIKFSFPLLIGKILGVEKRGQRRHFLRVTIKNAAYQTSDASSITPAVRKRVGGVLVPLFFCKFKTLEDHSRQVI
jgi:hypothetical protein